MDQIYENIHSKRKAKLLDTKIESGITVHILKRLDTKKIDRWCYRDFSKNWILIKEQSHEQ